MRQNRDTGNRVRVPYLEIWWRHFLHACVSVAHDPYEERTWSGGTRICVVVQHLWTIIIIIPEDLSGFLFPVPFRNKWALSTVAVTDKRMSQEKIMTSDMWIPASEVMEKPPSKTVSQFSAHARPYAGFVRHNQFEIFLRRPAGQRQIRTKLSSPPRPDTEKTGNVARKATAPTTPRHYHRSPPFKYIVDGRAGATSARAPSMTRGTCASMIVSACERASIVFVRRTGYYCVNI